MATARDRGPADREAEATSVRRGEIEGALAGLVDAGLVAEHRSRPLGRHSPPLARLLAYLRQVPTAGKLALHAPAGGRVRVLRLSGTQGVPHREVVSPPLDAEEDALHWVFLRRLEELGTLAAGAQGRLAQGSLPHGSPGPPLGAAEGGATAGPGGRA